MPGEFILVIILLVAVIGIYVGMLAGSFNKYKRAEEIAGEVLMEIEPSKQERFMRKISLPLCVGITLIICFKTDQTISSKLPLLIVLFSMSYLNFKYQKICENGILIAQGLVKWKDIEFVEEVNETSDKIKIHLKCRMNGAKKITLFCTPGEAFEIVRLIDQQRREKIGNFYE